MERVSATYYLEFKSQGRFVEAVRDFFSWAAMGSSRRFDYIDRHTQDSLTGTIVNIVQDSSNPSAGIVEYEFDDETFEEADLSLLLSVLLYSSIQGSTNQLRLLDVKFPGWLWEKMPGPRLGADGISKISGQSRRPMFGVILKPRQGLTPGLAADIALAATQGGADYIIDDEVMVNNPRCRVVDRAKSVIGLCEAAAAKRGRPILYVINVTSRSSRIYEWISHIDSIDRHDVQIGLMVNGIFMGFEAIADLRTQMPNWPLIANTVGCGMLVLGPQYNMSEHILVQLSRMAGADAVYAVRHATEYTFDSSKIDTLQNHLGRHGDFAKPAMPIYAGAISLGTILRQELPVRPEFMVQAGSTICAYKQRGVGFPESVRIATSVMVDALAATYVDGVSGKRLAERLVKDGTRGIRGVDFGSLGFVR